MEKKLQLFTGVIVALCIITLFELVIKDNKSEEGVVHTLRFEKNIAYAENEKGPYTGRYVGYYENSNPKQIKTDGYYINGKSNGRTTWWHKDGWKTYEGGFKDNKHHGLHIKWYKNGQKRAEENFKDGKVQGLHIRWDKNGKKLSEIEYGGKHKTVRIGSPSKQQDIIEGSLNP